jgi:hypothetical protein
VTVRGFFWCRVGVFFMCRCFFKGGGAGGYSSKRWCGGRCLDLDASDPSLTVVWMCKYIILNPEQAATDLKCATQKKTGPIFVKKSIWGKGGTRSSRQSRL